MHCDMTEKIGVDVTVISHDSENRMLVNGCDEEGCNRGREIINNNVYFLYCAV